MNFDRITNEIYIIAYNEAKLQRHEYFVPEHILLATLLFETSSSAIEQSGGNTLQMKEDLQHFFDKYMQKVDDSEPVESAGIHFLFESAAEHAIQSEKKILGIDDVLISFFKQPESFALYIMSKNGVDRLSLLTFLANAVTSAETGNFGKSQRISCPTSKEMELVKQFTVNLTDRARLGLLDPLIGREDILERTMQVLSRRQKNNPIHVGDPGVGKTAVVEGLASKIIKKEATKKLNNSSIYYLDLSSVLAGTKYRGDFEERLKKILEVLSRIEDSIIYIDEIHTIVGAGAVTGSAMDAGNILKPYLMSDTLRFIGSTTHEEYKKYFERDHALARRFQKIDVNEPSPDETLAILNGIKGHYEKFHNVAYTAEAVKKAVELSAKYIHDHCMPDKAIDVLDEAGANKRMRQSENEMTNLKNLEKQLKKEIFGQDIAVTAVVDAIKSARAGLKDAEKPVASLLFVGPTGVGKTELARQLASCLSIPLQRFDMSEYQEKHSVARLIGSPPGYVGYEEGGLLTETIRKTPYCVLLLDEIEKAHFDIYNVLLQVMDYGKLTDNSGRKSDFTNVVVIMTSNVGVKDASRAQIGYNGQKIGGSAINKEVERTFNPEFRNRLDDIIIFNGVDMEMAKQIVDKSIKKLNEQLAKRNVTVRLTSTAREYIAALGISCDFGAREVIRFIDLRIKKQIVNHILFDKLAKGGYATVDVVDADIKLTMRKKYRSEKIEGK